MNPRFRQRIGRLHPAFVVGAATLGAAAGILTIYHTAALLIDIWTTDDLKSMGMVVPFLSWLLILRAWRTLGWETDGSWWGLVVLAASASLMFLRDQMLLVVTVNKDWLLQLPPLPLEAVVYAAGLVLLFGGVRLLRAAWFPVLFMWAVIPVPQTFSRRIDLPLQHFSASVARAFAHALGEPLTQDKLRLMFTPNFGMFIAPGCNGIRGAITLGMAAVVVGYLYRFRWFVYAPVVAGAVLLGYLFNLVRLCTLVVYYEIALHSPWLQDRAEGADYLLGGCLFLCALAIFFTVAQALRREAADVLPAPADTGGLRDAPGGFLLRCATLLALSAVFGADVLRERAAKPLSAEAMPPLPAAIGAFQRVRTWNDTLADGVVVYTWAEYAAPGLSGPHVSLGISPRMDVHDAEICHMARGESPLWHGQMDAATPAGRVNLAAAAYNDGITQRLEAATVCDKGACGQYSHEYLQSTRHITLVYAHPHRATPLQPDTSRPVPVLLVVSLDDALVPAQAAEQRMQASLSAFLSAADLAQLTAPFSRR